MAYIWLDTEGNGISVQEPASAVKARFEDDPDEQFIEVTRATDEDEEPWRKAYVDKASIVVIEQGQGVGVETA